MMADPMDAFAHLSVGSTENAISSNGIGGQSATKQPVDSVTKTNAEVQYEANQIVCYKSNDKRSKARIIKKHLDDELEPFYTIMLPFGKEKQTDNAHLEPLEPAFERIEEKLLSFSEAQLKQVENFLSSNMFLATNSGSSTSSALPSAAM